MASRRGRRDAERGVSQQQLVRRSLTGGPSWPTGEAGGYGATCGAWDPQVGSAVLCCMDRPDLLRCESASRVRDGNGDPAVENLPIR
ncbi:hypothetical protein PR202_gb22874 [Eleusine coracana subsp. coracana]|uniref:Uncharacterized protein n=1 Tax=Eleusine coracana subsp. coracana TaxID=191504 RepID=A0AAV5FEX0_ELECO|nr:hypothetical protein PR202_gb22874 [Eleusine coracana subsp. coracana]